MANVKQIKQKTTGTLLDVEDTQARADIASEVVNRTNADNALQEKINTNKNDISELKSDLTKIYYELDKNSFNTVGYIGKDGNIYSGNEWIATDYINVFSNKSISFSGISHKNICSVALYDKNLILISSYGYRETDDSYPHPYSIEIGIDEDVYYARFTIKKDSEYCIKIFNLINHKVNDAISDALILTNSMITKYEYNDFEIIGYINKEGNINSDSNWVSTDFIDISNSFMINFYGISHKIISSVSFYDSNKVFVEGYRGDENEKPYHIELITPQKAKYVRFCSHKNSIVRISIINTSPHGARKDDNINAFYSILETFDNITCIGDSLTYSQVYLTQTNTGGLRQAKKPYPKVLEHITGVPTDFSIAVPGAKADNIWNNHNSQFIHKKNQLVIIYLGTNGGLTDTVDEDAPKNTDPSSWATTQTGYYARIINAYKNVNARIVLVKCYYGGNVTETNKAIESLAERFGCGVVEAIDLGEQYRLLPSGEVATSMASYHYNDIGYTAFAYALVNEISHMPTKWMKHCLPQVEDE